MPVQTPKEVFVQLLSDLRSNTERSVKFYQELSTLVADPEVKEALEARAYISEKMLGTHDQVFKLIGEKPVPPNTQVQEVFIQDFRKELAEIQNPKAKLLFIMMKAVHLAHLRTAEYAALVAAADVTGHPGVGVLLESCLADKLAFEERTRRLIRNRIETRVAERLAA